MNCPACENPLTEMTVGQMTIDACQGGCGGVWFDNFELKKVDEDFTGTALLLIERDDHQLVDYERRRTCPRCGNVVMMRHYFSDRRQVEVDTCPHCAGVWLDAGELAMIRREIQEKQQQEEATRLYFRKFFEQDYVKTRMPQPPTGDAPSAPPPTPV